MMHCQQFQDVLQDLARNDGLDVATLKAALEHADICTACDDFLQEAEVLTADLHSLAALDSSRQASPGVEAAVLSAFAQRKASHLRAANLRLMAVAGLAAVAAMAVFSILLLRRPKPAPIPAANSRNGREDAALSVPAAPADQQDDALAAFEDQTGAAGSFVPLTDTFDRTSLEGGTVLRVVMPRSALQDFGLSPGKGTDKQVLADMIVTSDGTPQAIRLVGR